MRKLLAVVGALLALSCRLALAVDPLPADSVADSVGMNVHVEFFGPLQGVYNDPTFDQVILRELAVSGIRYVRSGTGAPSGDSPIHKAEYYARQQKIIANGVRLSIVIGGQYDLAKLGSSYAAGGNGWFQVEGNNEPDLQGQTCAQITARQRQVYSAVKADPVIGRLNLPVLGPSLTTTNPARWLQTCPPMGLGTADKGNWHTYIQAAFPEAAGWMHAYLAHAQAIYPGLDEVITEYNYRLIQAGEIAGQNHIPGVPEEVAARYLPRWILFNLGLGFKRSFIHQIADNHPPSATDEQSGYGMLRYDGSPTPGWIAVKNLIALFNDPGPWTGTPLDASLSGGDSAVQSMVFQKTNGHYLIALWIAAPSWNGRTYTPMTVSYQNVVLSLPSMSQCVVRLFNSTDGSVAVAPQFATNGAPVAISVRDDLTVLEVW